MIKHFLTLAFIFIFTLQYAFGNAQASVCTKFYMEAIAPYISENGEVGDISPEIIEEYNLFRKDNIYFVGALALVNDDFKRADLRQYNVHLSADLGHMISLRIPIQHLKNVMQLPGMRYIETGETVSPEMEFSIPDTRTDSVHAGLGGLEMPYKGDGVIVVIIDWGFDYTHPVFYDENMENLRLTRAWDQNKMSGPPPDGYNFGTEYVGMAELLAAEQDTLYVFGPGSHGTHVGGIAGGNGAGSEHVGTAPEAELIFISLRRDAPSLVDAYNYVTDYAASVGKPYVVNMSFGSHLGPHDGTSLKNQGIDYYAGAGQVFVGSAGNNGNNNFHLKHDFTEDGDTLKTVVTFTPIMSESFGQTLSMWGSEFSSFAVALKLVDNNNIPVYETAFFNSADEPALNDTILLPNAGDTLILRMQSVSQSALNDKPNIRFEVRNTSNLKTVLYMVSDDATVHIWNNVRMNNRYTNWGRTLSSNYPGAVQGNPDYGLGEPAGVGKNVITVGSYKAERILPNGNLGFGNISNFSSKGPTVDGRTKPDITAPGQDVTSSVNSFDPSPGIIDFTVEFEGKNFPFSTYSGTSMSGPAVTGIVALMLQASPLISATRVKEILKETARLDNRTGEIGPEGTLNWGWGKINALAAVLVAETVVSINDFSIAPESTKIYPNPASQILFVETTIPVESYRIFDLNGRLILEKHADFSMQNSLQIPIEHLKKGSYLIQLNSSEKTIIDQFIVM
ncbi:MAG: T9SS C-terminal target domain-containing protein [Chitinophagaceae bacterium]|nr:MAG: T9SS C-terminal target domain-containing protein [Chitinophagaceae bacterium]